MRPGVEGDRPYESGQKGLKYSSGSFGCLTFVYLRMYNMVLVIGLCHASFAAEGFQIRCVGTMMFVFLPGTVIL